MIKDLINLANNFDKKGLTREANIIDSIIKKIANTPDFKSDRQINDLERSSLDKKSKKIVEEIISSTEGLGTNEGRFIHTIKSIDTEYLLLLVEKYFQEKTGISLETHINNELEYFFSDDENKKEIANHMNHLLGKNSNFIFIIDLNGDLKFKSK